VKQDFISVVVPFAAGAADAVNDRLSAMNSTCRSRLDAQSPDDAFVHFLSINVVKADDQHAFLVLEASVDGNAEQALQRLALTIGDELRFVLRAAEAGPKAGEALGAYLARHSVRLTQGWSFPWKTTVGVAFSGVPGMSVPRIVAEQTLA